MFGIRYFSLFSNHILRIHIYGKLSVEQSIYNLTCFVLKMINEAIIQFTHKYMKSRIQDI